MSLNQISLLLYRNGSAKPVSVVPVRVGGK